MNKKVKIMTALLIISVLIVGQVYAMTPCPACQSFDTEMYNSFTSDEYRGCGNQNCTVLGQCWAWFYYDHEQWACNDDICWFTWENKILTSVFHTGDPVAGW